MLPSLGFAASSLRASGQVPDAVWCGSLAIIIEQCGSNKTSELFQSFRCFTVFFFFFKHLRQPYCYCHSFLPGLIAMHFLQYGGGIWTQGLSKPVLQVPPWQTNSSICLPHIVLPISTCSYWDIVPQAIHSSGCNSILFHAVFVNLSKGPWKQHTNSFHAKEFYVSIAHN